MTSNPASTVSPRPGPAESVWLAGAVAGVLWAGAELLLSGMASPGYGVAVLAVFFSFGVLLAGVVAATEAIARRVDGWAVGVAGTAMGLGVRAAPAAVPIYYTASTLFDGSRAARMPGASAAALWMPLVGVGALAIALALTRTRLGNRLRPVLGVAMAVAAIAMMVVNRRFYPSEYPRVHVLLAVMAVVGLFGAARLCLPSLATVAAALHGRQVGKVGVATGRGRWVRMSAPAIALLAALALVLTATLGFASPRARWHLAVVRGDAHHVVRVLRSATDRDGDGFAGLFGGGDCDDSIAARNPAAIDIPANGIDEDCSGRDAEPIAIAAVAPDAREALAKWKSDPSAGQLIATVAQRPIVIISVDALRADAIGSTWVPTPRIDELMAGSVRFAHAISPAAGTDVSLATFVTGLANPFQRIEQTLFEAMAESGRTVHALLPREVLRYAGKTLLLRGMDSHDVIANDGVKRDVGDHLTSAETTARALAAVDRMKDKGQWALWVHYFDAHEHKQLPVDAQLIAQVDPRASEAAQRYFALVHAVDGAVGALRDGLVERGLGDATIVLFSDHGESLGEDPRLPVNHGRFLYEPLIRIPMAIRIAGVSPRVVDTPVSLDDLNVTLRALVGAPRPAVPIAQGAQGQASQTSWGADLSPLILGVDGVAPAFERPLLISESEQRGVVVWPYKYLVRPADNLVELYDLGADPEERNNLAAANPAIVARLKGALAAFPEVPMDRTEKGRQWRESQARR